MGLSWVMGLTPESLGQGVGPLTVPGQSQGGGTYDDAQAAGR